MTKLKLLTCVFFLLSYAFPHSSLGQNARPIIGCGERCIKLICVFYGKTVSEDRIKKLLRPNESGACTIKDLASCIKRIGLDCYAFKGSPQDLARTTHPVILHFKKDSNDKVGHFLVCTVDARKSTLIGYDPAMAGTPFDLTPENLDKFWTGAGLVIFPKQSVHRKSLFVFMGGAFLFGSCLALLYQPRLKKDQNNAT